jgi:ATP-dependent RNA helicase DDX56/DBP9
MSDTAPEAQTFAQHDLGLDRRLLKACAKAGFIYPTLVQSKCIPLALKGKDLLVRARTGSGKTAAYGLPLLQKLLARREAQPDAPPAVRAVVLVPTRELVEQVRGQLWELMAYCRDCLGLLALVDDNMSAQQAQLRDRPDIVVATPARLVAHLRAGNISLKGSVETLVVDEADLVLSYGYREDVKAITAHLPKICQGFLMSATLSQVRWLFCC